MSGPPNRDPPPLAEQFNPCLEQWSVMTIFFRGGQLV